MYGHGDEWKGPAGRKTDVEGKQPQGKAGGMTLASVPCGSDSDGMPVGLHLVGR